MTPLRPSLVLAATRTAADDWVRANHPHGAFGVHRHTLAQLAAALAARPMAERGIAPATALTVEAIAARAACLALGQNRLATLAPVAAMPGFARALARTIAELRLEDAAPRGDLALLLAEYAATLEQHKLADLAAILAIATETAQSGAHPLVGLPLLLLPMPIHSTLEANLLAALAARAPEARALVMASGDASRARLAAIPNLVLEPLEPRAIERHLFSLDIAPPPPGGQRLDFFSAPSESLECVEIARRILKLAAAGVPFDQMAILLRDPARTQPLVEEALGRAAIPAYFTAGVARPEPAGRAFLALLECALEGVSATRFAEYLSLGQAPAPERARAAAPGRSSAIDELPPAALAPKDDDPSAAQRAHSAAPAWPPAIDELPAAASAPAWVPPIDDLLPPTPTEPAPEEDDQPAAYTGPLSWEKLLVDAAVAGGYDRWRRRLTGLQEEIRFNLEALEDDDDALRAHLTRRLEQLTALSRFALPLIEELHALPAAAKWRDWLPALARLAAAALRRPEPVLATLNEMWPIVDSGPATLDEVLMALRGRLGSLRREPPSRRFGCVFVSSIEEARGRGFRAVFLPGLAEGQFPKKCFEDPLLLDGERIDLEANLRTQPARFAEERLLLSIAAAAAEEILAVSYPRMEVEQARPRVPSFYALELLRAAEGSLPALAEIEKRAAAAAPSRLGWPAPRDPHEAIDDAEFDLAFLDALPRGGAARGLANYLVQVNPHLGRGLRARIARWLPRWSRHDGLLFPDQKALEALHAHRLASRPYSPSALQLFASCPYRFFLGGILGLRPREEHAALEQIDPLTRGSLYHAVQFRLFENLRAQGLLPITGGVLARVFPVIDAVLDRVAAGYEETLAPAVPGVWRAAVEDMRGDLHHWARLAAAIGGRWLPLHAELTFGLPLPPSEAPLRDPASVTGEAVLAEGFRLRGSIDSVERDTTTGQLRVTDLKTGKAPEFDFTAVGGGAVLQPLLYALAAEQITGETVVAGRLYYSTERGGYSQQVVPLNPTTRGVIRRVSEIIEEAIAHGFLPAAPQRGACALCDFRPVCGPYEEQRLQRKPVDSLVRLIELRGLP